MEETPAACTADRHGDDYKAYSNWNCRCPAALAGWKRYKLQKLEGTFQPERVPAYGMHRRIQALQALGWSQAQIGEAAGLSRQAISKLTKGEKARKFSIGRIERAYNQLSTKTPPPSTAASRARAFAAAHGWAPPLAWNNIDDPADKPDLSWAQTVVKQPRKRGVHSDPCLMHGCPKGRWRANLCATHLRERQHEINECGHPLCKAPVWRFDHCGHHDIGIDFKAGDWFDWVAAERLAEGRLVGRKPTVPEVLHVIGRGERAGMSYGAIATRMGIGLDTLEKWRVAFARIEAQGAAVAAPLDDPVSAGSEVAA